MEKSKFKNLDILGSRITFNVEKKKKFKTVFGAFLSLSLISVSLILFSIYLSNFIEKKKPSNSYKKTILDSNQNIKGKDFYMIAGLSGPNSKEIQNLENKFIFSLRYFFYNSTINNYDFHRIELIPCGFSEKFKKLKKSELKSVLFFSDKSYFCVPDSYEFKDIFGTGSPSNSTWYVMDLFPCNGTKTKKTCVPYSELEAEIPHYSLQFIYKDNLVDISDFYQPIKSYFKSYFFPGTLQTMTQENLDFNKLIVESDDSFLGSEIKNYEAFSLKNREKTIYPVQGYDYRHKILIYVIDIHDVYYRGYIKLITILAIVYSNLKILITIFIFLNEHLSTYDIVDYIFSFLYNFDINEKNRNRSFAFRNLTINEEIKNKNGTDHKNFCKTNKKGNSMLIKNQTKISDNFDGDPNGQFHNQRKNHKFINKSLVEDDTYDDLGGDFNISHLKYFHNIKEKMPRVKNMNKFLITKICCCKSFREKRLIYNKMEFEVNDHLEIFNFITMSIIINNYLLNKDHENNLSFKLLNDQNPKTLPNDSNGEKAVKLETNNLKKILSEENNTISESLLSEFKKV